MKREKWKIDISKNQKILIQKVGFAVLYLWALIFYFHIFDQKLLLGDEGVALTNGWRISNGEIPNRDFFVIIPPFSFLPTAIAFKIFGPSVFVGRTISFILAFVLIFILNLVLKKTASDIYLRFMSVSLLIPFGVSYWPLPSHHWWCDIFCLISVYFLLPSLSGESGERLLQVETSFRPLPARKKRHLFLSGIFCALAVWSLQDQGGYVFILLISFMLFRLMKSRKLVQVGTSPQIFPEKKWGIPFIFQRIQNWVATRIDLYGQNPFELLLFFLSGFFVVTIIFLIWILPTAGLYRLFQDLVLFPLISYHNLGGHKFDIFAGWREMFPVVLGGNFFVAPLYSLSISLIALFFLLLPLISILSLFYRKLTKNDRDEKFFLVITLFISGTLTAFHRWSFTNIVWSLPCLLPSLVFLFEGRFQKVARIFSVFLSIFAILFSINFYLLSQPSRMVSLCARAGCLKTFSTSYSMEVKKAISFLETNSKQGETLFCAGFNSLINFLTQMKNPTPFNDFVNYNSEGQFKELKEYITRKKVQWILIPEDNKQSTFQIKNFIVSSCEYEKVFENKFCEIYKRKN